MIQRIQTLFLVLAIVCMAALFSFEVLAAGRAATAWPWLTNVFYLGAALFIIGCGVGIAQFADRPRQLKTVAVASLLALVLTALFALGFALHGDYAAFPQAAGVATGLSALALIFTTLARRAIARDIALVKSMDRLR